MIDIHTLQIMIREGEGDNVDLFEDKEWQVQFPNAL